MYFLDPRLGRRRRALLRDKLVHLKKQAMFGLELGTRGLAHRLQGLAAEGRHLLTDGDADDLTIEARVRSMLGRIVARPREVGVVSSGGIVLLSGMVAPHEHDALVTAVRAVRGVHGVNNDLDVVRRIDDNAGDQLASGSAQSPGQTFELMQENWSPAARLLACVGGGYLATCGLRRGGAIGSIEAIVGGALFLRGATNLDLASLTGVGRDAATPDGRHRGIEVRKTINFRADVGDVFGFFSNYDNFPLFMHNVREVRDRGDGYSHWTVAGPAGVPVTWDALLTDYQPNRCIAWESVRGAVVPHAGVIRFDETGDGSTRVDIRLCYNPPGGVIAHALASLLRSDPKTEMDQDLARLKTLIERGTFPHDAAQHASVMSPASPPIGATTSSSGGVGGSGRGVAGAT
jgi:uncharacterized membrane protein